MIKKKKNIFSITLVDKMCKRIHSLDAQLPRIVVDCTSLPSHVFIPRLRGRRRRRRRRQFDTQLHCMMMTHIHMIFNQP